MAKPNKRRGCPKSLLRRIMIGQNRYLQEKGVLEAQTYLSAFILAQPNNPVLDRKQSLAEGRRDSGEGICLRSDVLSEHLKCSPLKTDFHNSSHKNKRNRALTAIGRTLCPVALHLGPSQALISGLSLYFKEDSQVVIVMISSSVSLSLNAGMTPRPPEIIL